MRGDDVAHLQQALGELGFDAGRVDAIFGGQTQDALLEFQRNAGLATDAVFGPVVAAALERFRSPTGKGAHVGPVHEREALRRLPPTLAGKTLVIGDPGGLSPLADALTRALAPTGASVISVHHPDGSAQAEYANGARADLFISLVPSEAGCCISYYRAHGFESAGGLRLAQCITDALAPVLGELGEVVKPPAGMALPVLRETRMPAVTCEIGPAALLVERSGSLAGALSAALARWVTTPAG